MRLLALLGMALFSSSSLAAVDINFHGEVVSEPCEVDINADGQDVDFGTIAIKTFYAEGRSESKPFSINLKTAIFRSQNRIGLIYWHRRWRANRLSLLAKCEGKRLGSGA